MTDLKKLFGSFSANNNNEQILIRILDTLQTNGGNLGNIEALLQQIADNTDDLENLAQQQLAELADINLNTDTLEALLSAQNIDIAAILTELQAQTVIMNTHTTSLTNILNAITAADINNVTELQAIQSDLNDLLTELQAIEANTDGIEAALTLIENAITNAGNNTVTELQAIQVQLNTVITELTTLNATLSTLNAQYTGGVAITRVDISGNPGYVIPAGTYYAVELIVVAGSVSDGIIPHPPGSYEEDPQLNKTHPGVTFNATGATAYVKLMS